MMQLCLSVWKYTQFTLHKMTSQSRIHINLISLTNVYHTIVYTYRLRKPHQLQLLRITGFFFKYFILFIFRERGREGEREREKHQCMVASLMPPAGDLARNPGMCADWELNQRPFGSQASAQFTEPYQPGPGVLYCAFLNMC